MHSFARSAPLDLAPVVAPSIEDRTGPPLSQGLLFTMIATVASEHCTPEILDALSRVEPDAWYHGQLLESILTHFEEKDPTLVQHIGRNIYFFMRSQLLAQGVTSPRAVLEGIPHIWRQVTRGDGGDWTAIVGPKRARLEACQPYNCLFEEGTVRGLVEALDARNVRIDHGPCMRDGAPSCVFEIRWEE